MVELSCVELKSGKKGAFWRSSSKEGRQAGRLIDVGNPRDIYLLEFKGQKKADR